MLFESRYCNTDHRILGASLEVSIMQSSITVTVSVSIMQSSITITVSGYCLWKQSSNKSVDLPAAAKKSAQCHPSVFLATLTTTSKYSGKCRISAHVCSKSDEALLLTETELFLVELWQTLFIIVLHRLWYYYLCIIICILCKLVCSPGFPHLFAV